MIVTPETAATVPGLGTIPQAPVAAITATSNISSLEGADDAEADPNDPELTCMAKVVRHEAANQSRTGQLAVAQLIMNRMRSPRFPKTVCNVVNQPGQFFHTDSYNPSRNDALWQTAWEVSVQAMEADSESVIGEAIFYNTKQSRSSFHARRQRVATIGDHAFYN